ncbi:MAG: EF-hand domain-containing protein, partial [Oscillospiraceae bacterium]|nr:EF-hand domain-containing protein [Oscillospiraceae bacterium]
FSNGIKTKAVVNQSLSVVDLSNETWNLAIDSYSPAHSRARDMLDPVTKIQTVDPSESVITNVFFGAQNLGNWSAIQASPEQLATLGVTNMRNVSGSGYYSISFDAPPDWDENTGAYLDVTYGFDSIGWVECNGIVIPNFNNATDRLDLGGYLKPGLNTLTIKLNSTLYGRAHLEHHLYNYGTAAFTAGYANGLKTVTLTPYTQVGISDNILASIRADEAIVGLGAPASYTVSLDNAKGVGVVTLSFTADSRYLDLNNAVALDGFSIISPLAWEYIGSQMWKGTVQLYCPSFVNVDGPLDILKISGVALDLLGNTAVTLTNITVSGDVNGFSGDMPCVIVTAEAATTIVPKTVFSKYDLNHDGKIDELDLAIVVYYYLANDLEADWDVVKFDIASAKDCDVALNGRVDLADMIEVIANYCDSY